MIKLLKILFFVAITAVILVCAYFIGEGHSLYKDAISKVSIQDKIQEIKSKNNYTKYSELPENYIHAVISAEDKRFFTHKGINVFSIVRAVWIDIQKGKFEEGGSTITQQLAKNIYFTQEKKISRKIAEVFMAIEIEKECSKEEIFEMYVNTSYFGNGYYCIADASKRIF